jgi:hypothetical protein
MDNILGIIERENQIHLKTDFTAQEKERRARDRAVIDGKYAFTPHPMNWMEMIGPFKGKRIDFSRSPICLIG